VRVTRSYRLLQSVAATAGGIDPILFVAVTMAAGNSLSVSLGCFQPLFGL